MSCPGHRRGVGWLLNTERPQHTRWRLIGKRRDTVEHRSRRAWRTVRSIRFVVVPRPGAGRTTRTGDASVPHPATNEHADAHAMTHAELLNVYDREVRGSFPHRLPKGWAGEQDGPLARCLTPRGGFAMFTSDPSHLTTGELEAMVTRTFTFYDNHDRGFEWKTFDRDRSDLRPLLAQHGARPEPSEALVLGDASALAGDGAAGLTLRAVTSRADLERVAALESEVWAEDWSWLADDLEARLAGTAPVDVRLSKTRNGPSAQRGWCRSPGPRWPVSGAVARLPPTVDAASTVPWSRDGRASRSSAATRRCRLMPPRTADPFSNDSASTPSAEPCPT